MRKFLFLSLSCILATGNVRADDPTLLKNNGSPMRVEFTCTEDDMQFAGLACTIEEPCPIYLELSSIVPNGRKLVAAGNIHSSSGTIDSILLFSEDSGLTWKEPTKRIRGASIDQLQFYDFQSGWAAGETLYPLPRDPFFLVTTDGGDTWRQRAVSDDGGPGSIQRFWFDSAQHGELIIDRGTAGGKDRYSEYESQTGGESWNMKGTNDQIAVLRRAPKSLEHFDWRVVMSKDGKAYRVEKRSGDNWTEVASFLVRLADCKPPVREMKEPTPDTMDNKGSDKDTIDEIKLPPDPNAKKKKKTKPEQ